MDIYIKCEQGRNQLRNSHDCIIEKDIHTKFLIKIH
jgi:hypothetical protein